MGIIFQLIGVSCLSWLLRRLYLFRQLVNAYKDVPSFLVVFSPFTSLTWFPPFKTLSIPGVLIVKHQFYADDHSVYDKLGTDAYVVLHMIPLGARMFVADANAIKDITTARTTFTKPVIQYETLDIFGNNMLSSEGHAWTRYRKASISSFSERNLQCVCESSVRIMQEIFTTWSGRSEIRMSDTKDWTLKIALHVLSAAGFGMATTWDETLDSDVDRSFQVAVTETLEQFLWRLILPKWAFGTKADRDAVAIAGLVGNGWLGKKPQKAALVFSNLDRCLRQMIDGRQAAGIGENERDLMSNLIRANTEEDGDEVPLSLREVMGNMFVFLMAGHETVGHTLAFMFGLLALDPEEQDRLYEHIKSVLGDRDLTYHDIHSLSRVFAVVNETLRLYPPLFIILKECTTDATVNIRMTGPKATEETKTVAVVPGTWISINTTAVSYDPRVWKDPWAFNPDRFLEDPSRARDTTFLAFSAGPRSCIGRRFAEVEMIATATLLIMRYKISIDTQKFKEVEGESPVARRRRFMRVHLRITPYPSNAPLVFTRR